VPKPYYEWDLKNKLLFSSERALCHEVPYTFLFFLLCWWSQRMYHYIGTKCHTQGNFRESRGRKFPCRSKGRVHTENERLWGVVGWGIWLTKDIFWGWVARGKRSLKKTVRGTVLDDRKGVGLRIFLVHGAVAEWTASGYPTPPYDPPPSASAAFPLALPHARAWARKSIEYILPGDRETDTRLHSGRWGVCLAPGLKVVLCSSKKPVQLSPVFGLQEKGSGNNPFPSLVRFCNLVPTVSSSPESITLYLLSRKCASVPEGTPASVPDRKEASAPLQVLTACNRECNRHSVYWVLAASRKYSHSLWVQWEMFW